MWQSPKIDWHGMVNTVGVYIGDRFNAEDFNRIKNNIEYLRSLSIKMYEEFNIHSLGVDKTPADYFYADEINQIEQNLNTINQNTVKGSYGNTPIYAENGNIMDFIELNRIESAILDIHDKLTNQYEGRRMFEWSFGMKGGIF
ncbi:MAG: hypothetical protein ACK5L6_13520 [Anaerorhabdus sp.]|uniref:hypothetical protein n=1 Tax=Anaerorhabdus sp. TaxID=1872524 RepID=UPI003A86C839